MSQENWKSVKDFEGYYEVSTKGQVRSLDHWVTCKDGRRLFYPGKMMSISKADKKHYPIVRLYKDGVGKTCLVHRLVAEAFIPNPLGLPQVNHKDENRDNNCVENLEWCDSSYNMNYGNSHTKHSISAHKRPVCQYTKDMVLVAVYPSLIAAEKATGVSYSNIGGCCRGAYGCKAPGGFIWRYQD